MACGPERIDGRSGCQPTGRSATSCLVNPFVETPLDPFRDGRLRAQLPLVLGYSLEPAVQREPEILAGRRRAAARTRCREVGTMPTGMSQHRAVETQRRQTTTTLRGHRSAAVYAVPPRMLRTSSSVTSLSPQMAQGRSRRCAPPAQGAGMRRRDKPRRLKKASAGNNTTLKSKTAAAREGQDSQGGDRSGESRRSGLPGTTELADGRGQNQQVRDPRLR